MSDPARAIAGLLRYAARQIDVCVFTITDDRIADEILAAPRRGVAVRILTDEEKITDPGSDIKRFRSAGIAVRVDRSPHHMHHKFAVFDARTLLTGSYNWTRAASEHNKDNFIVTGDAHLVQAFSATFESPQGGAALGSCPAGEMPVLAAVGFVRQLQRFDLDVVDFAQPMTLQRFPLDTGKGCLAGMAGGGFGPVGCGQFRPVAAVVRQQAGDPGLYLRMARRDVWTVVSNGDRSSGVGSGMRTRIPWTGRPVRCSKRRAHPARRRFCDVTCAT